MAMTLRLPEELEEDLRTLSSLLEVPVSQIIIVACKEHRTKLLGDPEVQKKLQDRIDRQTRFLNGS